MNQVITVKRRKYATGLFWQPVRAAYTARGTARVLSRSMERRFNLFTEYRSMVGLGSRSLGHRTGMSSAAAEVLNKLDEFSSFLAVFDVGGVYYLLAVRNAIILQDEVFVSADAARKRFSELAQMPDWGALIAPGVWGLSRTVERSIDDMFHGPGRAFLRPINRAMAGIISGIVLILFVVGLFTFFRGPINQMTEHPVQMAQINPELAAEYKRQIEEKNKQLDEQFEIEKTPPPAPIVMPYNVLPDRYGRADACYRAIGFLMQQIPGWVQTVAECDEKYAYVQVRRTFGTLGDFYAVAGDIMPATFVQELGEDMLSLRVSLPSVQVSASVDERDVQTLLRDVTTVFQMIGTPIEAEIVTDTLTNGVDVAELNLVEIAVESKLTPMQFTQVFDEFGGVYLTGCSWNATDRLWNYEVIIYAK